MKGESVATKINDARATAGDILQLPHGEALSLIAHLQWCLAMEHRGRVLAELRGCHGEKAAAERDEAGAALVRSAEVSTEVAVEVGRRWAMNSD